MPLRAFTEVDALRGLRERGLVVERLDDLTAEELDLIREYVDSALNEAARKLLDMLAARIRRDREIDRARG